MSVFSNLVRGMFSVVQPEYGSHPRRFSPLAVSQPSARSARLSHFTLISDDGQRAQGSLCRYRTVADLKTQWHYCDQPEQAGAVTAILVINRSIRGNLRELISRNHFSHRLIIVTETGYWPGTDSLGDLALSTPRLGWGHIRVCRDLVEAISESTTERLLIFVPDGLPIAWLTASDDLAARIM